jgi:hypothetical protein
VSAEWAADFIDFSRPMVGAWELGGTYSLLALLLLGLLFRVRIFEPKVLQMTFFIVFVVASFLSLQLVKVQ